jgi:hypothetical protein
MIQRIQTVYLLLVCIISFVLFFTPISLYKNETKVAGNTLATPGIIKYNFKGLSDLTNDMEIHLDPIYPIPALNIAIIFLCSLAIYVFKRRSLQMALCKLLILMNCVLLVLFVFYVEHKVKELTQMTHWGITYLTGTYLPIASIFFLYLAHGAIKKDDKLVKSADRLR